MLHVEIRVKTRIAEDWVTWFEGLALTYAGDETTVICGDLIDQAALYGLMAKIRDLGLPLESVSLVDAGAEQAGRLS